MSSPDDDLHGRQLLLLLAFFGAVGGGLYFVGWLTRPNFLDGNPVVCAAIAGAACYPARFLVERCEWWRRLERPTKRTLVRRQRAQARRARRRVLLEDENPPDGRHSRPVRGRPRWFKWF